MLRSLTRCTECGGKIVVGPATYRANYRGEDVPVDGRFQHCVSCGLIYVDRTEMVEVEARVSALVRERERLLQPGEVRDLRKRLGLTQQRLEQLLGVGPKTVVRWERGTVHQSRTADNLLRLLDGDPTLARRLHEITRGTPAASEHGAAPLDLAISRMVVSGTLRRAPAPARPLRPPLVRLPKGTAQQLINEEREER